ncbi:hypothetical protein [Paraflavitalea speifideaquila]|uniref:hypothetical protein n=1 Tax=Paraflavitalea speifideaquila TaxID=3076558 RepID=UPI0028E69D38|nr:hypothetical protein [Paraflavitalea speifideiaquila]
MLHDLMHYKRIVGQKEEFLNVGNWELELATNKLTWSEGMYQLLGYGPNDRKEELDLYEFYRLHMQPEEIKKPIKRYRRSLLMVKPISGNRC